MDRIDMSTARGVARTEMKTGDFERGWKIVCAMTDLLEAENRLHSLLDAVRTDGLSTDALDDTERHNIEGYKKDTLPRRKTGTAWNGERDSRIINSPRYVDLDFVDGFFFGTCPNCGSTLGQWYPCKTQEELDNEYTPNYCEYCGQALDFRGILTDIAAELANTEESTI